MLWDMLDCTYKPSTRCPLHIQPVAPAARCRVAAQHSTCAPLASKLPTACWPCACWAHQLGVKSFNARTPQPADETCLHKDDQSPALPQSQQPVAAWTALQQTSSLIQPTPSLQHQHTPLKLQQQSGLLFYHVRHQSKGAAAADLFADDTQTKTAFTPAGL